MTAAKRTNVWSMWLVHQRHNYMVHWLCLIRVPDVSILKFFDSIYKSSNCFSEKSDTSLPLEASAIYNISFQHTYCSIMLAIAACNKACLWKCTYVYVGKFESTIPSCVHIQGVDIHEMAISVGSHMHVYTHKKLPMLSYVL